MKAEKARYQFLHDLGICAASGREGDIEVAHLRLADDWFSKPIAGVGAKPSYWWTLPLCRLCHREQHHVGERNFWAKAGFPVHDLLLSPLTAALVLGGFHQAGSIEGARKWLRLRSQGRL